MPSGSRAASNPLARGGHTVVGAAAVVKATRAYAQERALRIVSRYPHAPRKSGPGAEARRSWRRPRRRPVQGGGRRGGQAEGSFGNLRVSVRNAIAPPCRTPPPPAPRRPRAPRRLPPRTPRARSSEALEADPVQQPVADAAALGRAKESSWRAGGRPVTSGDRKGGDDAYCPRELRVEDVPGQDRVGRVGVGLGRAPTGGVAAVARPQAREPEVRLGRPPRPGSRPSCSRRSSDPSAYASARRRPSPRASLAPESAASHALPSSAAARTRSRASESARSPSARSGGRPSRGAASPVAGVADSPQETIAAARECHRNRGGGCHSDQHAAARSHARTIATDAYPTRGEAPRVADTAER